MSDENTEMTEEAKEPEETEPKQEVQETQENTSEIKPIAQEKNENESAKPVAEEKSSKCPEWYAKMSPEQKLSADNIMKQFSSFTPSQLLNELKNKLNREDQDCQDFMHWWLHQNQEDQIMEEEAKREPAKRVGIVRPIETGNDIEPIAPPRFKSALTPGTYQNTLEQIPKTLGQCGRMMHRISSNEDCLYNAVAHEYDQSLDPKTFRKLVCEHIEHLKEHGSEDQKKIIAQQEQKYGGEEEFKKLIKIPGKWERDLADLLPHVIGNLLALDIHVYDENYTFMPEKSVINGNDTVRLIFNGENSHYDATTPNYAGHQSEQMETPSTYSPVPGHSFAANSPGFDFQTQLMDFQQRTNTEKRFGVGQRVVCKVGLYSWEKGTITDDDPPVVMQMAGNNLIQVVRRVYNVETDEGNSLFVPEDSDRCCRELDHNDDNPILHEVPAIPMFEGREFQGRFTSNFGPIEFQGVNVIIPEKKRRQQGSQLIMLRDGRIAQLRSEALERGRGPVFEILEDVLLIQWGDNNYCFDIEDDGKTLDPKKMDARAKFGLKLYKYADEDERPIYRGKSLEGSWYAGGSSVDCMVTIRGCYVVWSEEYLAKRRAKFKLAGYDEAPDEKSHIMLRGSTILFLDQDKTTVASGEINHDGKQITWSVGCGFGVWQKFGDDEPVTITVNDFPLGLYECQVQTSGIERGARHYVSSVRADGYKIFGKLDDAKETWALLAHENDIYFKKMEEDYISEEPIYEFLNSNPAIEMVQLLFRIVRNCKTKNKPIKVAAISKRFGGLWDSALAILGAVGFDVEPKQNGTISFTNLNIHEVDYVLRRLKDRHVELKKAKEEKENAAQNTSENKPKSENKPVAKENESEKKKEFEGEN